MVGWRAFNDLLIISLEDGRPEQVAPVTTHFSSGSHIKEVIDMPIVLLLKLTCQEDGAIYGFTGQHASYAFQGILGEHLVQDSFAPGASRNISAWTISPLLGVAEMRHRRTPLLTGDVAHLRFTLLDDRLLPKLEESLHELKGYVFSIGGVAWQLSEILGAESGDSRTGYESYEDLSGKYLSNHTEPPEVFKLSLSTPTVVKTAEGEYVPFPIPNQLFLNWLRSWAMFAPRLGLFDKTDVETLSREVISKLTVFRYNLKAIGTSFAYGSDQLPEAGCTGRISLRSFGLSRTERQIVAIMIDYASYAGTGIYTELGLGQTSSM